MNTVASPKKEYNPIEKYTLSTIDVNDVIGRYQEDEVYRFFWYTNPHLVQSLCSRLVSFPDRILDVGCGTAPFPKATHLMDFNNSQIPNKTVFKVDLDFEQFPYSDSYFNFTYCRHTLEDIQNPQHAFREITRVSKSGFIETPSPLVELLRGVDGPANAHLYRGYIHHRYIVWSDMATNTLYFLPKYPLIESIINEDTLKWCKYLANHYPVYWNNYYFWDNTRLPNIVVYRNGINMKVVSDYPRLLNEAVLSSILYTNKFIREVL